MQRVSDGKKKQEKDAVDGERVFLYLWTHAVSRVRGGVCSRTHILISCVCVCDSSSAAGGVLNRVLQVCTPATTVALSCSATALAAERMQHQARQCVEGRRAKERHFVVNTSSRTGKRG